MSSSTLKKTGGGRFDPHEGNIYFIASNMDSLEYGSQVHDYILIAINEVNSIDLPRIERWLTSGKKLFIDSGVFNLATTYARKHDVSMDVALSIAPEQMEGFEALFKKYVNLIKHVESDVWGYIEIDQGGRDNKIKTRARLEALGLRPIPVYHPLNDGWDYFDELASQYDRICFGNIVQADPYTRKRLLATMWERHRRYPELWIHILGLTPNTHSHSYPSNSADSSSWLAGMRWSHAMRESAMGAAIGAFSLNFRYRYGSAPDEPDSRYKALLMAGYCSHMLQLNWRNHIAALKELGIEVYPHER
jgi:hypothetical protein